MNLNATILGRCHRVCPVRSVLHEYVWPPLMAAIEKRQKEIADGLASAERAKRTLTLHRPMRPTS